MVLFEETSKAQRRSWPTESGKHGRKVENRESAAPDDGDLFYFSVPIPDETSLK